MGPVGYDGWVVGARSGLGMLNKEYKGRADDGGRVLRGSKILGLQPASQHIQIGMV